jgi:hypothetical protein
MTEMPENRPIFSFLPNALTIKGAADETADQWNALHQIDRPGLPGFRNKPEPDLLISAVSLIIAA